MTKELEQVICKSAIRSPSFDSFIVDMAREYQNMVFETWLLRRIYDVLQQFPSEWNRANDPVDELVNWEAVANGVTPRVNPPRNSTQSQNPIAGITLEGFSVAPGSGFTIYQEQASTVNNAVLVNNLVFTGTPLVSQNPTSRNMSRGGPPGGY